MRVREAMAEDIPDILRMGRAFYARTAYQAIPFDDASCAETAMLLMQSPSGALFVADLDGDIVGMVGALLYPFYLNHSHVTGQELFWWVDEAARKTGAGLALIAALETWAAQCGASSLSMMSLEAVEPDRVARLYASRGYEPSEHTFLKVLH